MIPFLSKIRLLRKSISINGRENIVMQNVKDSTVSVKILASHNRFYKLEDWLNRYEISGEYISCPVLEDKMQLLCDPHARDIKLVALSGLGKTRIVYECFKDSIPQNAYYCFYSNSILDDFSSFLMDDDGHDAKLIVLDECPNNEIQDLINKKEELNPNCRLIFINNDFFKQTDSSDYGKISIDVSEVKDAVNSYIDKNVPVQNNDTFVRDQIKRLSGGYPFLAIKFVKAYKEGREIRATDAEGLMSKLLGITDPSEMIVMRTLALFQPLGFSERRAKEFDAVALNNTITPLFNLTDSAKKNLFNKIVNRYNGVFIDKGFDWLSVRPLPLAVWLVGEWLRESDYHEVIKYLNSIPEPTGKMLIRCMCKRLEEMVGNSLAKEIFETLANNEDEGFITEEVVCSGMGSRLFLSMATVNPVAIGNAVIRIISRMSIEDLRVCLKDDARRNIVLLLEKLCYVSEVAKEAIVTMAKLAVAENETWANNSFGQLKQFFHIILSGTVLSLKERTEIIKQFLSFGIEYKDITLEVLNSSLCNMSFSRDGGADQFGTIKITDYYPSSREIIDYWSSSVEILVYWLKEDPSIVESACKVVLDHLNPFIGNHNLFFLKPLIDQVLLLKNNQWDDLYDEILRVQKLHDQLSETEKRTLDEWALVLRPHSFVYRLKEARGQMYKTYRLSDDERLNLVDSIYRPLAEQFVNDEIYLSHKDIYALVFEYDFYESAFLDYLRELLDAEKRLALFSILGSILKSKQVVNSQFLYSLCESFKDTAECSLFINHLLEQGNKTLYVDILAKTESLHFDNLHHVETCIREEYLDNDALLRYLIAFNPKSDIQFAEFIEYYDEKYPHLRNATFQFVVSRRFLVSKTDSDRVKRAVYKLAEEYILTPEDGIANHEYTRFTSDLLRDVPNPPSAFIIANKYISALSSDYYHGSLDGMLDVLLRQYPEETWNLIAEKFILDDSSYFHLQASHEIGSGFGFGRGPLFDNDDRVIELCKRFPQKAPQMIAGILPVFDYNESGSINGFSRLFIFLVDEYGDSDTILHDLNANMHTYSWVGSPIPLLEKCKECFSGLLAHKRQSVRTWARNNIEAYDKEILREKSQDEFERMHYDHEV